MKATRKSGWTFPAVLFVLGLISFAPVISKLGVYWDDWPSLWFLHFFGPASFSQVFAFDRPVQGRLFVLTTSLLGESMIAWHIFGILARWTSALAFGWVLSSTRPAWKPVVPWTVLLFFIYPGFDQQYIPITYSHQFVVYSVYLASLGVMLLGARRSGWQRWGLTGLALVIALLSLLSLEYFFGLELLRPVLLFLAISGDKSAGEARLQPADHSQPATDHSPSPVIRSLIAWLPYLILDAGFLAWRLTHATPRGQVQIFDQLSAAPLPTLLNLLQTVLVDVWQGGLAAWGRVFTAMQLALAKPSFALPYLAVTLGALLLVGIWFAILHPSAPGSPPGASAAQAKPEIRMPLEWMGLGIFALLVAGWPFWATGLRIDLTFPWDRFTLPMMAGSSLLLAGMILLVVQGMQRAAGRTLPGWVLIALIVGLGAGSQIRTALSYRQDWLVQREMLWQLAWRVPGLEPGTLLITDHLPFTYVTDNSLTAPLNWMYAPDLHSPVMPYLMYDLNARLDEGLIRLEKGEVVQQEYRIAQFEGSTSQALVFYADPERCLKVVGQGLDGLLPNKPEALLPAYPFSREELIQAQGPAASVLAELAGPEPEHGWCYYFEKAELAVQEKDWPAAVALAEQAKIGERKFSKEQAGELLPFILGYGFAGQMEKALALSQQMINLQPKAQPVACAAWAELGSIPAGLECSQ